MMIPVVLITFNRPELVKKQIDVLRQAAVERLYFVSDGPRTGNADDICKVNATRELHRDIDWECELIQVFSDKNMGCDARVVSALNFVFDREESAIILEDDCIPNLSFFPFCEELLRKYACNHDVMYISGTKLATEYKIPCSYGFSYNTGTWGWATWKRAWREWHWNQEEWDENKTNWLKGIYSYKFRRSWIKDFEKHMVKGSYPWDYVWRFCVGERLSIFPAVNLISNVGFGGDATHTVEPDYGYNGNTQEIEEFVHPKRITADVGYPRAIEDTYRVPLHHRIKRKLGMLRKRSYEDY